MTKIASGVYNLLIQVHNLLITKTSAKKHLNNIFLFEINSIALPYLQIKVGDITISATYSSEVVKIPTEYIIFYKFASYSIFLNLLDEIKNTILSAKFAILEKDIVVSFERICLNHDCISMKISFYMEVENANNNQ